MSAKLPAARAFTVSPNQIIGYVNGKPVRAIAGGSDDAPETPPAPAPPAPPKDDKGFPENTPLAEMTSEQREAYWKDKARKHEARANSAPKAEDVAEWQRKAGEYDKQQQAQMSDLERATAAIAERDSKIAEKDAELAKFQAKEVRLAALTEAGLSLDWLENITASEADAAKAQAEGIKTRLGAANTNNGGGVPQGYQGGGSGKASGLDAGRERYEARKKKTT